MTCFWSWDHDWEKWEQYKVHFISTYQWGKLAGKQLNLEEDWQKRRCKKCGKEQRIRING